MHTKLNLSFCHTNVISTIQLKPNQLLSGEKCTVTKAKSTKTYINQLNLDMFLIFDLLFTTYTFKTYRLLSHNKCDGDAKTNKYISLKLTLH